MTKKPGSDWYEDGIFHDRMDKLNEEKWNILFRDDLPEEEKRSRIKNLTEIVNDEHEAYFALKRQTGSQKTEEPKRTPSRPLALKQLQLAVIEEGRIIRTE